MGDWKMRVPIRVKRAYRRWVSPIIRDSYYHEYAPRRDFFREACFALAFNQISGDYFEFGSCGGITFALARRFLKKYGHPAKLYAFDSFVGLPPGHCAKDKHPMWVEGTMSMSVAQFRKVCRVEGFHDDDFCVVPGFYDETLVATNAELPVDVSLVYVDCDLYSSTRTVLEFLARRWKHGMIIAFDDYYCWSDSAPSGERLACAEHFRDNASWTLVPFARFGWGGMSFVVEQRSVAATGAFW